MPPTRSPQRLLAIVDAATEVFAQRGFSATQMVDVARAAGVSVGTLYNYVEGKEALLLLCAERPFADIANGRALPVATPDRHELLARLAATLDKHVRVAALERALASGRYRARARTDERDRRRALRSPRGHAGRRRRDGAQRPRRAGSGGALLSARPGSYPRSARGRTTRRVDAVALPPKLTPDLAARFTLETVTWWARHRHRDPGAAEDRRRAVHAGSRSSWWSVR